MEGCDHLFFVGFLGAGKSTLARNLGSLFHRPHVDTDRLVERALGASVAQIFAREGEGRFREAETAQLRKLAARKSLLVSCGGGIVERPENCELMHEMGVVVFLDGDLADSLRQIQRPDLRPDLGSDEHAAEGSAAGAARSTRARPTSRSTSGTRRSSRWPRSRASCSGRGGFCERGA